MITAAIKQREVDERISLDDGQVLSVLEKMIKQRKEAIIQFESRRSRGPGREGSRRGRSAADLPAGRS